MLKIKIRSKKVAKCGMKLSESLELGFSDTRSLRPFVDFIRKNWEKIGSGDISQFSQELADADANGEMTEFVSCYYAAIENKLERVLAMGITRGKDEKLEALDNQLQNLQASHGEHLDMRVMNRCLKML